VITTTSSDSIDCFKINLKKKRIEPNEWGGRRNKMIKQLCARAVSLTGARVGN
jgi:hypothetical protein